MLSRFDFNNIDVITDIETIGTNLLGIFATTQLNRSKDNFYLLEINTNKDYNAIIHKKNDIYLPQNNTNQVCANMHILKTRTYKYANMLSLY